MVKDEIIRAIKVTNMIRETHFKSVENGYLYSNKFCNISTSPNIPLSDKIDSTCSFHYEVISRIELCGFQIKKEDSSSNG